MSQRELLCSLFRECKVMVNDGALLDFEFEDEDNWSTLNYFDDELDEIVQLQFFFTALDNATQDGNSWVIREEQSGNHYSLTFFECRVVTHPDQLRSLSDV